MHSLSSYQEKTWQQPSTILNAVRQDVSRNSIVEVIYIYMTKWQKEAKRLVSDVPLETEQIPQIPERIQLNKMCHYENLTDDEHCEKDSASSI